MWLSLQGEPGGSRPSTSQCTKGILTQQREHRCRANAFVDHAINPPGANPKPCCRGRMQGSNRSAGQGFDVPTATESDSAGPCTVALARLRALCCRPWACHHEMAVIGRASADSPFSLQHTACMYSSCLSSLLASPHVFVECNLVGARDMVDAWCHRRRDRPCLLLDGEVLAALMGRSSRLLPAHAPLSMARALVALARPAEDMCV